MTYQTFNELWEAAENAQVSQTIKLTIPDLTSHITNQLTAYQAIDASEAPEPAKTRLKEACMGEILLTMTQLSYKDNINTFVALQTALEKVKILSLADKYQLTSTTE
jgi:hypothetical protein